jgi:teichoic acid transport system ATP-binding protein
MTKIIQAKGLTKIYRLYAKHSDRVREAFSISKKGYHNDFYALNNVDFEVSKGETVGIIGRNGSGKSTLLKILTGVTSPTAGTVKVEGRISALLELGAGLNMEMTGLENVYLNGTINGMTRSQVDDRLDDIIEFADIGDFIVQPVKTYSSGMFVRLAFSMAIHIDPDVLIVDEALSVGDIFFQQKCYRKFEEFKQKGKTILFVTHDMNSVLKYCDRAMVLDEGVKLAEGTPKEMVDLYKKVAVNLHHTSDGAVGKDRTGRNGAGPSFIWKDRIVLNPNVIDYGDGKIRITDFGMFDESGAISQSIQKDHPSSIRMRVRIIEDVMFPIFAMTIKDIKGNEIVGTNSKIEMFDLGQVNAGTELEISFDSNMLLQGGQYFVSLGCTRFDEKGEFVVHHRLYDVFSFQVVASKFVVGIFDMGITMKVQGPS